MTLKPSEIRDLTTEELEAKHAALSQELLNLRQQARIGKLEKADMIHQIKKDVARVLTILREKGKKI